METHDGMQREKSRWRFWAEDILVTCIYTYTGVLTFQEIQSSNSISLPLCYLEFARKKPKFSEMEHVGDLEEQTSITIDKNEIPFSDSEDDSFSSPIFEEFGIFKRNGLTRIDDGSKCYKIINGCVAYGSGQDKKVVAVHKVPWSGPNGRLEAFRAASAEMVNKCERGNANIKHAWYGGLRDELCGIISHGFHRCRQSDNNEDGYGVYLHPLEFVMDGLLSSAEDEYGLQHILLCNVVLGKMEEVRPGSKQFKPSSNEFDSGVDDLSRPTRFIIWEAYMNSRIFPSYVVSFRALNVREGVPESKPVQDTLFKHTGNLFSKFHLFHQPFKHFGDLEEQTSITIDKNEIPLSDSEDCSFSSFVFEEFGIFKSNGLTRIEEVNAMKSSMDALLTVVERTKKLRLSIRFHGLVLMGSWKLFVLPPTIEMVNKWRGVLKELLDLDASSRKIQVLNNLNSVQFYASVRLSKRIRDCAGLVDAFKEIARLSTHSTLAACGLERPKPGVCSFPSSDPGCHKVVPCRALQDAFGSSKNIFNDPDTKVSRIRCLITSFRQFIREDTPKGCPVVQEDVQALGVLLKMEHFGDQQEQVSISIDPNEIPISDSEDDSFSSSIFEEFGIFKRNGLTVIEEGNTCYKVINGCIARGMGKDTNVAAIHKIPWSGPNGRLEAFHISSTEMVEKCGGNGNVKHAWYGGSRDEICEIISHGFRRCRQSSTNAEDGYGVYLYPLEFVMDGLLTSTEDDYGLRHLLLCNVILGKTEVVRPGSKQFKPSSDEFDSGVDDLSKPNRMRKNISRAQLIYRLRQLAGDELLKDVIKTRESDGTGAA
ncbi:hypothetical protein RHMOL_Rhmol12G0173800 [Rhododendron molle]|uniref:Uncharacterized protein n=1 Tax=Rhododendron molle TaxID=49168 RepID=A0ACC0LKE1_RHOML|nr:hypothetical protein RHMOL_Rhmol12G0173800 [Rhododendron molle]